MIHIPVPSIALGFVLMISSVSGTSASDNSGSSKVVITDLNGKLRIEIGGQLFSEYYYRDVPRPFFYPIIGAGGLPMTRNYPMKTDAPDEAHDHVHHRSLWYAHGDINGHDFWAESPKSGTTVHEKFLAVSSGSDKGVIRSANKLVASNGNVICTDERLMTIHSGDRGERILDFDITVRASNGAITFGDTKEGTMAIRLAETMRLKGKVGRGHIINSEGVSDADTWGKRAKWCDYYGPVQDKIVGVAIFDHPNNPRHPTWWHVRDYGLFAANPFGIHDFEKNPDKAVGNLTVPAGQSITFRYRFFFHAGDEKQGKVAERYQEYVAPGEKKSK